MADSRAGVLNQEWMQGVSLCQIVMQLERFLIPQALQMLCRLFCVANVNTEFKTSNEIEIRSNWEEEDGNMFNTSQRGNLIFFTTKIAFVESRSTLKIG